MQRLKFLERAPVEAVRFVEPIITALVSTLDVEEMRRKRGADYNVTKYYQVRVKPRDKNASLEDVLKQIESYLKRNASKLKLSRIQINQRSFNSGKYSSVSFEHGGMDFDIVVAAGANQGEIFERELLLKMDNLIAGVQTDAQALAALRAIEAADRSFRLEDIVTVVPRAGPTNRSGDMTPSEIGKVIADIIIKMKRGPDRYVSVKNRKGSTLAQFGISRAFNDDLSVNVHSAEWNHWLAPFNLDPKKVERSLRAAATGEELPWDDVEVRNEVLRPGSAAYRVIEKMWGSNYYYLRETGPGKFKAFHITPDFVRDVLMRGLKITEIRYPGPARKQLNIYLENDIASYKLSARNPRGKGEVRPTQIQLTLLRSEI